VTGMESPSSVKRRVIPTLRPIKPKLIFMLHADFDWSAII
jgi:hypothetical protein